MRSSNRAGDGRTLIVPLAVVPTTAVLNEGSFVEGKTLAPARLPPTRDDHITLLILASSQIGHLCSGLLR